MHYSETYVQIENLLNKYNLGKLILEPEKVTGGLMHTMYQVTMEHKKYAVKEMNASVMQRKGVVENVVNSERVAKSLEGIIPVIAAIQYNDTPLLNLDGKYYMVFNWLDGISIFPPNISRENCIKVGTILGKIHAADIVVPKMCKDLEQTVIFHWNKYLLEGTKINAEWVQELSQVIGELKKWNEESHEVSSFLNECMVLSHRDMDPKNVMWNNDNPFIIDWEAAGYVNPYKELLGILFDWTKNDYGELDKDKFENLYHAYIEVVGKCQTDWEKIIASGYSGMLGWLDFNFK